MAQPLTLMTVHAHPDDEVLSTGGTIAKYAAAGARTVLVTCTNGEVGEINDPNLDPEEARVRLAELRLAELERSAAILGIGAIELLRYRDSGMMGTEDNDNPASFWQADLDEAAGRLVRLIRLHRPHVVVTYDENGNYGHPDHINANRVTVRAVAAAGDPNRYPELGMDPWQPSKLYYTAWSRERALRAVQLMDERGIEFPWRSEGDEQQEWGVPRESLHAEIDVRPFLAQKMEALRAHRTQIGPEWFFLNLPEDILELMTGWEAFVRVENRTQAPDREASLFDGVSV